MRTREEIEGTIQAKNLLYSRLETEGGGWAIVAPELGAKVLAAGVDRESAFWVNPELDKGAWCVGGAADLAGPGTGSEGILRQRGGGLEGAA